MKNLADFLAIQAECPQSGCGSVQAETSDSDSVRHVLATVLQQLVSASMGGSAVDNGTVNKKVQDLTKECESLREELEAVRGQRDEALKRADCLSEQLSKRPAAAIAGQSLDSETRWCECLPNQSDCMGHYCELARHWATALRERPHEFEPRELEFPPFIENSPERKHNLVAKLEAAKLRLVQADFQRSLFSL